MPAFLRTTVAVVSCALLAGCAIRQTVKPVEPLADAQVCIVERPAVKAGFLDAYTRALTSKGYQVRQLPPMASINDCPVTSTYNAIWRWDLALYMALAEINVYRNGRPAGEARYDAQRGGGNLNKFISAEAKVGELVGQLFPNR